MKEFQCQMLNENELTEFHRAVAHQIRTAIGVACHAVGQLDGIDSARAALEKIIEAGWWAQLAIAEHAHACSAEKSAEQQ